MLTKNSSETIGNRTRDLPTCSGVSQATASPCAPICNIRRVKSRMIVIYSKQAIKEKMHRQYAGRLRLHDSIVLKWMMNT